LQRVFDKLISESYQGTYNWLRAFLLGDINQRQKQIIGELYQHYSNFMHYYSGKLDNFYVGWSMLLNQISTKEDMIIRGYPPEEEAVGFITLEEGYAVLIKTKDSYSEIPLVLPFTPNLKDIDVRNAYFIAFCCLPIMTEISKHFPEMIAVGDLVLVGMYDDQYINRKTTVATQLVDDCKSCQNDTSQQGKQYNIDVVRCSAIYKFCTDEDTRVISDDISKVDFISYAAKADFKAIHKDAANQNKTTKCLYIINILSYAIEESREEWYRTAANSVGTYPKRCGSANVDTDDGWKTKADKLKSTKIR